MTIKLYLYYYILLKCENDGRADNSNNDSPNVNHAV